MRNRTTLLRAEHGLTAPFFAPRFAEAVETEYNIRDG